MRLRTEVGKVGGGGSKVVRRCARTLSRSIGVIVSPERTPDASPDLGVGRLQRREP